MRRYKVEILRISSFVTVFFYRRFLPLDVFIYAFGAETTLLPQICLSPCSSRRGCLKLCICDSPSFYQVSLILLNCKSASDKKPAFRMMISHTGIDFGGAL